MFAEHEEKWKSKKPLIAYSLQKFTDDIASGETFLNFWTPNRSFKNITFLSRWLQWHFWTISGICVLGGCFLFEGNFNFSSDVKKTCMHCAFAKKSCKSHYKWAKKSSEIWNHKNAGKSVMVNYCMVTGLVGSNQINLRVYLFKNSLESAQDSEACINLTLRPRWYTAGEPQASL